MGSTIESILAQTMDDFEFIIVDDGSKDGTGEQLAELRRRDSRIRPVIQENRGLTGALIAGCELANGIFLARQDVGDHSAPERLEKQIAFLSEHQDVVAVGTGYRRIGPAGEYLGQQVRNLTPEQVTSALQNDGIGLAHTVAMIRLETFRAAGGYRAEFRFAQDSDLWYRMSEHGLLAEIPECLFDWGIDVGGISASNRCKQQELARLASACFLARQSGEDESALLAEAHETSWSDNRSELPAPATNPAAAAEFFIGSQLYTLGDSRCRPYLKRALSHHPLWIRAWMKLAFSYLKRRGPNTPVSRVANG